MGDTAVSDNLLDRIFFITERVVVFDGLDDMFGHIIRTSSMLTRAEAADIRAFNIGTGDLRIVKGVGFSNTFFSQPPVKLGEGVVGRVVLEGKHILINDLDTIAHNTPEAFAKLEGIKTMMCIPLKTKENTIGSITVYRKKNEPFTEHDLLILSVFAGQAAEAIEKTQLLDELKKQATYDPLTGLYNKGALLRELDSTMRLALRHGNDMSLMFIDIDNFKLFNDTHGHLLGDKLLCDFSKMLRQHCRKTDILGRFGGEEFVIITPHTTKQGALTLGNKLREAIGQHRFIGRDGEIAVTFSAGVSAAREDGLDAAEILKKADDAMYRSKRDGKNRITAWS